MIIFRLPTRPFVQDPLVEIKGIEVLQNMISKMYTFFHVYFHRFVVYTQKHLFWAECQKAGKTGCLLLINRNVAGQNANEKEFIFEICIELRVDWYAT